MTSTKPATQADRALLRDLEEQIPLLEDKLRAMKVTRKRLKAAEAIKRNRRPADPVAAAERMRAFNASPEGRAARAKAVKASAAKKQLPFAKGTRQWNRYKALTRTGIWTR